MRLNTFVGTYAYKRTQSQNRIQCDSKRVRRGGCLKTKMELVNWTVQTVLTGCFYLVLPSLSALYKFYQVIVFIGLVGMCPSAAQQQQQFSIPRNGVDDSQRVCITHEPDACRWTNLAAVLSPFMRSLCYGPYAETYCAFKHPWRGVVAIIGTRASALRRHITLWAVAKVGFLSHHITAIRVSY